MLERVFRPGGERDQAQELLLLECAERLAKIVMVDDTADLPEERLIELLADDGRRLQEVLRLLAEPINASGEECLHRGGKSEGLDRRRQAIVAALPDET